MQALDTGSKRRADQLRHQEMQVRVPCVDRALIRQPPGIQRSRHVIENTDNQGGTDMCSRNKACPAHPRWLLFGPAIGIRDFDVFADARQTFAQP